MVNMPHRSSESLMAEAAQRFDPLRDVVDIVAYLAFALLAAALVLHQLPPGFGGQALHDLVPVDDPVAAAGFTA